MSVCSETFLFQNLLWRVCRWIVENDPCTCQLSISAWRKSFFWFFFFCGSLSRSCWERMSVNLSRDVSAEVIVPNVVWKMPGVHDKLLVTLIIHSCTRLSLKNDCLCSAGSSCHSPPGQIFASVQNYICRHQTTVLTLLTSVYQWGLGNLCLGIPSKHSVHCMMYEREIKCPQTGAGW